MPNSHFEIALEKALAATMDGLLKLPLDDAPTLALKHAHLVGRNRGLQEARDLYRTTVAHDPDEDTI